MVKNKLNLQLSTDWNPIRTCLKTLIPKVYTSTRNPDNFALSESIKLIDVYFDEMIPIFVDVTKCFASN